MLRWGGSSQLLQPPSARPTPNKLPSSSAARPPQWAGLLLTPGKADLAQYKGLLSPACGPPTRQAGEGEGKQLGHALGPLLALEGSGIRKPARPGAQSLKVCA